MLNKFMLSQKTHIFKAYLTARVKQIDFFIVFSFKGPKHSELDFVKFSKQFNNRNIVETLLQNPFLQQRFLVAIRFPSTLGVLMHHKWNDFKKPFFTRLLSVNTLLSSKT